jgi:hypothetical protein
MQNTDKLGQSCAKFRLREAFKKITGNRLGCAEPHSRFPLRFPLISPSQSIEWWLIYSTFNEVIFSCVMFS